MSDVTFKQIFGKHVQLYSSVASSAWLCWDFCLTLDQEVEFAWPLRWSITKCAYYLIRWLSLIIQAYLFILHQDLTIQLISGESTWFLQPHVCLIWKSAYLLTAFGVHSCVEYVLLFRVLALYSRYHRLKNILSALCLLRMLWLFIVVILFLISLTRSLNRGDGLDLCRASLGSKVMLLWTCATLLYHILLFVLMLVKFVTAVRAGWNKTPVMMFVMRDGSWSFFFLFAFMSTFGLFLLFADHTIVPAIYSWFNGVLSFIGYRNLLNIFKFSNDNLKRSTPSESIERGEPSRHVFSTIFSQSFSTHDGLNGDIITV